MKSLPSRIRDAGVPALLVIVTACGSAPDTNAPADAQSQPATNYYLGSDDVFAHLVTGTGGSWQFTRITTSNAEPDNGYLVRLNDLAPAFDTRVAECTPQAYSGTHKCSPAHPFRDKEVGVINKIISGGIAAGTAGKVTDVSARYRTTFDEARFNQAVDEALINSGLDRNRQELFDLLEEYSSTAESGRVELDARQQAMNDKYRDTATLKVDIRPTITGLTEYYSHDIDLHGLIEIIPRSSTGAVHSGVDAKNLLPCEARNCLADARRELDALRSNIETARFQLASTAGNGLDVYELRCDKTEQQGYLFRLECPKEVRRNASEPVVLPLSIHLYARDFEALYPSVTLEDENLQIDIDGEAVSLINKTDSYLTVTTQTVYYNSHLETTAKKVSVAPGARVTQPIQALVSPVIEIESSFRQMTPDKSKGTSFEFGFAANYRVAGVPVDSTLFTRRRFSVACVIDNRLRPGSCIETPAVGAGAADAGEQPLN